MCILNTKIGRSSVAMLVEHEESAGRFARHFRFMKLRDLWKHRLRLYDILPERLQEKLDTFITMLGTGLGAGCQ